jgi:hypothetical protein
MTVDRRAHYVKDCQVNVLRDAMAVDTLDKCRIHCGTTGGQVYASGDGGNSWNAIVRDLQAVVQAMLKMNRIVIEDLQKAHGGSSAA